MPRGIDDRVWREFKGKSLVDIDPRSDKTKVLCPVASGTSWSSIKELEVLLLIYNKS